MKICKFLLVFCLYFVTFPALGAEVNIAVNKKTITDGDTVQLTIEYNGDDGQKPDISPLQQDFQIVSRGSSNYVNFINGQLSQLQKWTLELKPKKVGKITIKPIKVGNISSNYAEIEVKELTDIAYVPDSEENINSPYFQIEQSHFPDAPYVQQQMTILVTVYDSIGLQNGTINVSEDTRKNWIITSLTDKPIVKQDVINNKRMNVVTFAFAAFPQKSGELIIPEFSFEGYYLKNNDIDLSDFDDFMNFGFSFQNVIGQQVPVRMKTKEEKITIKPIPDDFSGKYWLPLKNLKIETELSEKQRYKVGDAISRKLQLTATGLQKNMVPQIDFSASDAFKYYPEKPETTEQVVNGDIVTTATINTVYIPIKEGKQFLPSTEIEWFNVETQRIEKTRVLPTEIFIEPNPNIQQNQPVREIKKNIESQPIVTAKENLHIEKNNRFDFLSPKFYSIAAVLFAALLFIIFLVTRKPKNPYCNLVINCLKKRNYQDVRKALIEWAKIKFKRPDIANFNMITEIVNNSDFTEQLSALNKFLYSGSDDVFDSTKFIEIFKKIDKLKYNIQKNREILPNLYD